MQPSHGFPSEAIALSAARRNRVLARTVLGLVWLVALLLASSLDALSIPVALGGAFVWMVGPGRHVVPLLRRRLGRDPAGTVSTWTTHLVFRAGPNEQTVASQSVLDARLHPLTNDLELRLDSGRRVTAKIPSERAALALLDAAGVPPQRRTLIARLGPDPSSSRVAWSVSGGIAVVFSAMLVSWGAPLASAILVAPALGTVLYHLFLRLESAPEIEVAWNGVTLARPGGRTFHNHGGLRDVRLLPSRLTLVTDDGNELAVPLANIDPATIDAVTTWIRDRRASFSSMGAATDAFAILDRRGRSLEAWRDHLRGVLQQEGQYRRAPLTVEDVQRLLASPHTPAERRVAAAFILAENRTILSEKQIRFAAESSSSQPMRIALRALAEDRLEAAAIEEALASETGSLAR